VKEARYRCANRAGQPTLLSAIRAGGGLRTRVYGFAGRCLASRPRHRHGSAMTTPSGGRDADTRPSPWQGDALPTEPHPHFVCSVSLATRYNSIRRWRHTQNRSRVIVLTPADRAFRVGVL